MSATLPRLQRSRLDRTAIDFEQKTIREIVLHRKAPAASFIAEGPDFGAALCDLRVHAVRLHHLSVNGPKAAIGAERPRSFFLHERHIGGGQLAKTVGDAAIV